jgi:hypothetical protein
MTQEALKLALEALENHTAIKHPQQIYYRDKAITAIKEALAQPEQEPFGYFKAEPFGWTDCAESDVGAIALYQTPPRRTWVGLTDDEQQQAYEQWQNDGWGVFYNAIEAKLKQKNG